MNKFAMMLVVLMVFIGSGASDAHAFWWMLIRSAVSHNVVHKSHHHSNHHNYDARSQHEHDAYNAYHNHPDGERSQYYHENDEKRW